jgi:erythromycin esterase
LRPAAVILAAALGCPGAATADPLPVRNLKFEQWDASRTRPEGWWIAGTGGYKSAADCDIRPGRCVLRFESLPGVQAPGQFVPLGQSMPSTAAVGHALRLTGWIRTQGVAGWAGLWMRVDAPGRPHVALDNMHDRGPRGTSDWRRFEVILPVPRGSSSVVFGVLLSGSGVAWFDDLDLEIDTSVRAAALPEIVSPPRPLPSKALASEAAVALPRDSIPDVKASWREDVRRRAHAIRSLFSEDFSDLQFLKPLLARRRLVMLGESSHGVAEFNWMKARLVRFLHREMGFDVLAFESSLSGCDIADGRIGSAPPEEVMRACIFQVWHSTETLGLFQYLEAERKAGRRLTLAGFDPQNSGTARPAVSARLESMVAALDPAAARTIADAEARLAAPRSSPAGTETLDLVPRYREAAALLSRHRGELGAPGPVDLAIQELESRARLAAQLAHGSDPEGSRIRDEAMADNLEFLLDRLYAGRKIVAWAHNSHIAKARRGASEPLSMGAWIAKRRDPAEVYSLGIYMGRGVASTNDRKPYEIPAPSPGSFEAVLANGGWRMAFVDFTTAAPGPGSDWIFSPLAAREWGMRPVTLVPASAYDGVLYVDTVTPPDYLPFGGPR